MRFPKNFLWGAAASAPQTESYSLNETKSPSTWDYWFALEPKLFHDQISINNVNDTYTRYKEDIDCLNQIGFNSFRTSIAWTRLLPDGKTLNLKAVKYYRDYFQSLKAKKIKLFVNLFHFDLPMWLMDEGGWLNPEIIQAFGYYAQTAFENFGDLVDYWITFNEPNVHIECSYLTQFHYPALTNWSQAIQAGYHTLLAHAQAVKIFRQLKLNSQIGIVLIASPVYSKSNDHNDLQAKENAELLFIKSFLDPCALGVVNEKLITLLASKNLLPKNGFQNQQLLSWAKVDFLGVNYYQPIRVQATLKNDSEIYSKFFSYYNWPQKIINSDRGWEIYPEGIYDLAQNLTQNYPDLNWFIGENGIGRSNEEQFKKNNMIQDQYRIDFIKDHLKYLNQAINDGAKCFGYHVWTIIDCWSWLNGYKNRYGFYELDLNNQKERKPKASAIWMKEFLKTQK